MHPHNILLRSFRLQRLKLSKASPKALSSPADPSSSSSSDPSSSSSISASASASTSSLVDRIRSERPYAISRTASGSLPVYSEVRNGGGWKTIVRKVDGDVKTLQNHLIDHFESINIDPLKQAPQVSVKPTNRHLVIRGKYVEEVKAYLEDRGF